MVTTPGTELAIPAGVRTRRWPRATQCTGTVQDAGGGESRQCRRRALRGGRVCYVHGGQLPSGRAAAEAEVNELRGRLLSAGDKALDVLEDAMDDPDVAVRVKAAAHVLDRVVPRQQPGAAISVVVGTPDHVVKVSPSTLIRERLVQVTAAMSAERRAEMDRAAQPENLADALAAQGGAIPWEGEPVEGELVEDGWS